MLRQLRDDDLANLIGETGQPARRQFFAADFEQQFAVHATASPRTVAVQSPTYALAMPTASCRTRRM